jgi:hypothetical protein
MSGKTRAGCLIAIVAVSGLLLLLPSANAAAGGPVAHKSGAIVNYTSTGKIKVAKNMYIYFSCAVNCNATSTTTIKGLGGKISIPASGPVTAGVPAFIKITIKGQLLKLLKAEPGAFKVINNISATDPATGAVDNINHTFKLKR